MALEGSTLIARKIKLITMLSNKTMIIYIVTASIFSYLPHLMSRLGTKTVFASINTTFMDVVVLIPVSLILIMVAFLAEMIIDKIRLGKVLLGR